MNVEQVHYAAFEAGEHLPGVLRLCEEEGWDSFPADPGLAAGALRAPGVTTVVAVAADDGVVGFAQMQSDGALQAHLSLLAVDSRWRGLGIGRWLVQDAFDQSGAGHVDLISTSGAEGFYESFPHKARSGFRIYPSVDQGTA